MEISFILVEPAVPENIGASARAIKTMGFNRLYLINPSNYPDKKASILAHASTDILENASVFQSLDQLKKHFDFLIATTAKKRRTNENYIRSDNLPGFLEERKDNFKNVGLVFGREESGLSNDEIRMCDLITYVPLHKPYPSLNLSQAVMIYAYALSDLMRSTGARQSPKSTAESIRVLKEKVTEILELITIKQQHIIKPRIMERMSYLKREDISLLHSISNSIIEKFKSHRENNQS